MESLTLSAQCCIDFGRPFIPGTTYRVFNSLITTSCGFTIRTDRLTIRGVPYLNYIRVEAATPVFGAGNVINTNNATLHFIRGGATTPIIIKFEYLDRGGTENLFVNGVLYAGELNTAPASLGSVTVSVTSTPIPLPAIGKKGTVTLSGKITEFKIGGQEFYLDNFCFR